MPQAGSKAAVVGILRRLSRRETHSRASKQALRYYTNLVRACPDWLSRGDWVRIRRIYREAKRRGMTVDHIVPLKNPLVCGLHVPWNLAIVSRAENVQKSNTWWPDCPFSQGGFTFDPQIEMRL